LDEEDKPPESFTEDEFESLYRTTTEIDAEPDPEFLEQVWERWQRTGHTEGEKFLELRYCERCETHIEGSDEAITHATQNHGYDALTASSDPDSICGERSMSVGDIVERDDQYYACVPISWEEIELVAPDGGTDKLTASYHREYDGNAMWWNPIVEQSSDYD
jgi:hypothetical protein